MSGVIETKQFFVVTLFRVFVVSALVFTVVFFLRINIGKSTTIFDFVLQSSLVFFSTIVFIFLLGIESSERIMLTNFVKQKLAQFKNKTA